VSKNGRRPNKKRSVSDLIRERYGPITAIFHKNRVELVFGETSSAPPPKKDDEAAPKGDQPYVPGPGDLPFVNDPG
jgi:hypothetical protein